MEAITTADTTPRHAFAVLSAVEISWRKGTGWTARLAVGTRAFEATGTTPRKALRALGDRVRA